MVNKITKIILFVLLAVLASFSVSAIANYCGDGICTNMGTYTEGAYTSLYYCPYDCGFTSLIPLSQCPTSPNQQCSVNDIPVSNLNAWCSLNSVPQKMTCSASTPISQGTNQSYELIIGLALGLVIGYIFSKRKK